MKNIIPILTTLSLISISACSHHMKKDSDADSHAYKTSKVEKTSDYKKPYQVDKEKVSSRTADSQMEGTDNDVEVTRKIRDRITDTDELSMKAQNITIVTKDDKVTLRGEVEKRAEIKIILGITRDIASTKRIDNQLTIQK